MSGTATKVVQHPVPRVPDNGREIVDLGLRMAMEKGWRMGADYPYQAFVPLIELIDRALVDARAMKPNRPREP